MSESYTVHLALDKDYAHAIASTQSYLLGLEVLGGGRRGCRRSHHQTQKTRHCLNWRIA